MATPHEGNGFDRSNKVEGVEVLYGEEVIRASYYIDGGIIVAMIGDKIFRCPVSSTSASDTVRAMVTEVTMATRS